MERLFIFGMQVYQIEETTILQQIIGSFPKEKIKTLVGPSGAGKYIIKIMQRHDFTVLWGNLHTYIFSKLATTRLQREQRGLKAPRGD